MSDISFWFKILLTWNLILTMGMVLNHRLHASNKDLWYFHYLIDHKIDLKQEINEHDG